MTGLRAITVRPPYSWAIAVGAKTTENRGREVYWDGEFAVHAGAATHPDGERDSRILNLLNVHGTQDFARGAILAVAELVDCHQAAADGFDPCCSPWGMHTYNGRPAWHLGLANIRRLAVPVPCRGQLSVGWRVPADIEAAVRRQLTGITYSPAEGGIHV